MQRFTRPSKPADFEGSVERARQVIASAIARLPTTAAALQAAQSAEDIGQVAAVAQAAQPAKGKGRGTKKKDGDPGRLNFPPAWGRYKAHFVEAQHGKCAYCDAKIIANQDGDVEHFYPKGEVWALRDDPVTWGQERRNLATVQGRLHDVVSAQGYWWYAYDWTNYLLACRVCNSYWKLSFFPVKENPRTAPPREEVCEIPLLLNAFDQCNPADHLRFDWIGQIEARVGSHLGRETIRTCGLDRLSLQLARKGAAEDAYQAAQELRNAVVAGDDDATLGSLRDFRRLGQADRAFSGIVRAIFEDQCELNWADLEAALDYE